MQNTLLFEKSLLGFLSARSPDKDNFCRSGRNSLAPRLKYLSLPKAISLYLIRLLYNF